MGAKTGLLGKAAAFLSASILFLPSYPSAMEITGRISESVFNQSDTAPTQNYNYLNTRLKLDAADLNGVDNSFHFDGSNLAAGQNAYNNQIPVNRVDALNLRFEKLFSSTDVVLGRQMIDGLTGAKVDGALLENHSLENVGFGVFGGLLPDPYTDAFASSYLAYGGYGFYKDRQKGLTAGYATSLYQGVEDQAYIFGSAYYAPSDSSNTNASARFDHALQGGNGYYVTNLLLSTNYNWGRDGYLNLAYNQYRAVWYQQSMTMTYGLNFDLQTSMRVYGDYGVSKTAKIYADYDYRQRDSDGGVAFLYMLGIKDNNLLGRLYYNVAYRNINYFTALSSQASAVFGVQATERVSGDLGATYAVNAQNSMPNQMTQMIYSASASWLAAKKLSFICSVEMSNQQFLSVDAVYLAKYGSQYQTTSVFANLAYRF